MKSTPSFRFTKIVATVGPPTSTAEKIEELAGLGIDVFRLNFSHGDYKFHGGVIDNIRAVNGKGRCAAIMLDTKGPEIRTGDVKVPIIVRSGERFLFIHKPTGNEKMKTIQVDYSKFADDVKHARSIIIDNGSIEFKVDSIVKGGVVAVALENGSIGSRRHINLPGASISLPSFTAKDWSDIEFGVKNDVDFIATSFVRTGKDIRTLKEFLRKHGSEAHVIAKIETPQGVENIDEIIAASDGVMVARGDLGAEVPFEDVPKIQDEIVRKCRAAGKPVMVATHMLESMILSPTPTRAEVTDVAYAARMQADTTMLSGETASGKYPVKAVETMDRILRRNELVEQAYDLRATPPIHSVQIDMPRREQALAACVLATKLHVDAMIVISRHGFTAAAVSNCRPQLPIHTFTNDEACQRRMKLLWGVVPHCINVSDNTEKTIGNALTHVLKKNLMKKGQRVVVVSDLQTAKERVMSVQVRTL